MRNNSAVAAELHVHRQTGRYRLGQLRELLVTRWTIRPSGSAYCSSWDGSRR